MTEAVAQKKDPRIIAVEKVVQEWKTRERREAAAIEGWREDFWRFAAHVRTRDEDEEGRIRPFPLDWPFVHELIGLLNNDEPVGVVAKSRRVIATITVAAWCCWQMLRTDLSAGELWTGCMISINEKKAKKFVKRVIEIHDLLPDNLRREWSEATNLDRTIKGGGSLEALHAGGSGPRSEGYAVGIMDECGFQVNARDNYRALRQCARKTVLISSANGRGNLFDEKWDDGTVQLLELHYSKHPNRVPGTETGDAWKKRAMIGQSKSDWAREQEMDRDVYATVGYYGSDWTRDVVRPVEWDEQSIITIGMDYSYKHPAAVVSFVNEHGQWCRIREYLQADMTLERFAPLVFDECVRLYSGARFRIAPDPFRGRQTKGDEDNYGKPATDLATVTRIAKQIFGDDVLVGIHQTGGMRRSEGHRRVRRLFVRREDDERYGTVIDPKCKLLIQGFSGAYGPLENATPKQEENEEPDDSRLQVHIMDADRYGVCEFTRVDRGLEFKKRESREVTQCVTGAAVAFARHWGGAGYDDDG